MKKRRRVEEDNDDSYISSTRLLRSMKKRGQSAAVEHFLSPLSLDRDDVKFGTDNPKDCFNNLSPHGKINSKSVRIGIYLLSIIQASVCQKPIDDSLFN